MLEDLALAPFDRELIPDWGIALLFGALTAVATGLLTRRGLAFCGEPDRGWSWRFGFLGAAFGAGFTWLYLHSQCQETPMVRPDELWWSWRIGAHLYLISLLLAATATDFRAYLIPDVLTLPGLLVGVLLATVAGQLQVQHLWIDWNQEIPQLAGAYVPEWIKHHPHLHGLAWSLTGALVGAGAIWAIRLVSTLALGQEAMGLGDVTLMALIGSFLGWQPVVFVLLLAPLLAIGGAVMTSLFSGRSYIPYGPYLSLAAIIMMFGWRWIWMFEASIAGNDRADDRNLDIRCPQTLRRLAEPAHYGRRHLRGTDRPAGNPPCLQSHPCNSAER